MYSKLYEELEKFSLNCQNEEELRAAWIKAFSNFGIEFNAERDKNDLSYNQVIIELKSKGLFRGKTSSAKFAEAVEDRLQKYIVRKSKAESIPEGEYTGIATDGDHIVFCYVENGAIRHQDLMQFSSVSVKKVAKCLKGATRRALTSQNLIEDFGHDSDGGIKLMGALSKELSVHFKSDKNNKIKMLFQEWQSLFGQVSNLTAEQLSKINKQLNFSIPDIGKENTSGLLFIIHTYNALIMKLIGAEIVSYLDLTQYRDFCGNLATCSDQDLLNSLDKDIERSGLFESAEIKGFIEEAIFSWYLDLTEDIDKQDVIEAIRDVLIQLSLYRFDNLDGARSRDVLKGLYQSLVPDVLRKSLGEFYTPDWLVEKTAETADIGDWLYKKVLDPTCGSGSFLLNAVKRKRLEAVKSGISPEETIDILTSSVWGFDLNPLAVQAARVNFLISISDLIAKCKSKEIEIPVLLADSVYSPARDPLSTEDIVEYRIGSKTADLLITLPSELGLNRQLLDKVFGVMADCVDDNLEYDAVEYKLKRRKILKNKDLREWTNLLGDTYNRVLTLHRKDWNGIWFRIVRNFFWSATAGKFDLILGNPPWVRWSALPIDYREKVKPTCEQYEIFSETKFHGGNELDISGMISYTVSDKWLKDNGKLVFVITQTHFQSPSSQGFRSFKIDGEYYLKPEKVEDLKLLKPFPDAANKTVIASFLKTKDGLKDAYPVKYNIWKAQPGFKKAISEHAKLSEVSVGIDVIPHEANPVGDSRSPWAIMEPGCFEKTECIRGKSDWISGRKGVTADLNGIYMVEILDVNSSTRLVQIETRPNAGKKDIGPAKKFWVEPDLLFPLVKGAADFDSCFFSPKSELYIFVPNKGITKKYLLDAEDNVENDLRKSYTYFKSYKDLLLDRSTYKARLSKYEFYHIYNVGSYSFSPYKVMWAEQSGTFKAAVASSKDMPLIGVRPYVPDHKVYFVDCSSADEAYYLCGLLNSDIVSQYVESHTISIQVSNIFKHMELPKFNRKCRFSKAIAEKVKKIHKVTDKELRDKKLKEVNLISEKVILGMQA